MLQIDPPDIDDTELWDKIVSNKKGARKVRLRRCRQRVLARYAYYQSHYESLEKITPLDASSWVGVKEDLQSCYGDNATFSEARKVLLSSASKCPYCLLSRPNTLDHYFDKSAYPEYSVFTPNLIPCCSECNSLKGASLFDNDQQRQFVHFYFDSVPSYQYLFIRFAVDSQPIPQISLDLQFQENEPFERQIRNHFARLNLLEKYHSAIVDRLPVTLREIKIAKASGNSLDEIREIVQHKHQAFTDFYKSNYWETCMYEGILNSEGFLETFFNSEQ